jgi:Divergent InlB B-repeat domain
VSPSDGETTARLKVGGFDLEIGASAGASVSPAPALAPAAEPDLGRALEQVEEAIAEEKATLGTAVTEAVDEVDDVTSKVERATELFETLASGRTLDPMQLRPEIDSLLDRLAQLDRSGRLPEALRLARALEKLLAIIKRWEALGQTLTTALRSARGLGDTQSVAWVRHELGTLQLAADDPVGADRNLSAAHELRQKVGDHAGLRVTEGNLQSLCHELRQELRDGRLSRAEGRGSGGVPLALPIAAALVLLLAGGVAGAVIRGGGESNDGAVPAAESVGTDTTGPEVERALDVRVGPGGSVRTRRGDIDCPKGACSARFADGADVILVADADDGFEFKAWGGDCAPAPEPVCTLTLRGDRTATAAFAETQVATATLTVSVAENLSVTSEPEGIACPGTCVFTQPVGTPVTLTAARTGDPPPEDPFDWGASCSTTPGTSDTCGLVLTKSMKVSVGYEIATPSPTTTPTTTAPG